MILYPAIDLKDGQAVRLLHGDMDQVTVFNDDPEAQALAFVEAGCEWLHLVDLNGAFAGKPINATPVEAILKACNVPAQLGGGIRDMATIESWLAKGLARVILGTVAVSSLIDLQAIKDVGTISGAISGRAIYDGAIDLEKAIKLLA